MKKNTSFKQNFKFIINILIFLLCTNTLKARLVEYTFDIDYKEVNFTGKKFTALSVGGSIPAPKIEARVGDLLRVTFVNKLHHDSSVHWHGILLPNGQDGVPLLTTPSIKPGTSFTYEFPVIQSGTYWYHSHTGFQEQIGVYGPLVFHPKIAEEKKEMQALKINSKRDFTVVLTDWNNEDPHKVFKKIKYDKDYFSVRKDAVQSWWGVLSNGKEAIKNRFQNSWDRMGAMDISDFAYEAFLANGKKEEVLPVSIKHKDKERVRIRLINSSSSTFFNIEFAGGPVWLIASDGVNIKPILVKRFKITNAETYDLLLELPQRKILYELRATAEDGTGHSSVFIGEGKTKVLAPDVPRPNIFLMSHTGHAHANHTTNTLEHSQNTHANHTTNTLEHSQNPHANHTTNTLEHSQNPHANHTTNTSEHSQNPHTNHTTNTLEHSQNPHANHTTNTLEHSQNPHTNHARLALTTGYKGGNPNTRLPAIYPKFFRPSSVIEYMDDYNSIEALNSTMLNPNAPEHHINLKLTGYMERFVWSFDDKTISESEDIIIKKGERVFFHFENTTMMQHPIHLHGHFFRVLNGKNTFSPLKHTVNIKPFSKLTIEFYADQEKNWFMHCHILYHMMAGMARVIRYEPQKKEQQTSLDKNFNDENLNKETSPYFIKKASYIENQNCPTLDTNCLHKNESKEMMPPIYYDTSPKAKERKERKEKKSSNLALNESKKTDEFEFNVEEFKKLEHDKMWHSHFQWSIFQNSTHGMFRTNDTHNSFVLDFDFGYPLEKDLLNPSYTKEEGIPLEANMYYERNMAPLSRFWDIYLGVNSDRKDRHDNLQAKNNVGELPTNTITTRAMVGLKYLLPLLISTNLRIYHDGGVDFGISSDLTLVKQLKLPWEISYKFDRKVLHYHVGLLYNFTPEVALEFMYSEHYLYSLGLEFVIL